MSRISDGDIKIPAFQRGYVWKQDQVIEFLDSIINNYPVGTILLWNTDARLKSTRDVGGFNLPNRELSYPVNYVLDGQQRLSTIYAAFCQDTTQREEEDEYAPEITLFNLSYDFHSKKIVPTAEAADPSKAIILRALLDPTAFIGAFASLDVALQSEAKALHSKFLNYEIPVITVLHRGKEEVGLIFERINRTGTKLSTMDLMIAWTWSDEFHLKEKFDDLLEILDGKGFGDIPDRILLQALAGIISDDTTTKSILTLDPAMVQKEFPDFINAMEKAIDFIATQFKATSIDFLPHLQQISAITKYFYLQSNPTSEQLEALMKWFWKTSFSRRYSGQTDDKMNADIQFVKQVAAGNFTGLSSYSHTIDVNALLKTKFSKAHPFTRALLLLQAYRQPLDLVKGTDVDVGKALSTYNRREYHHVFPRAFLKRGAVPPSKIDSVANFCMLPADSNKRISGKSPSVYIPEFIPDEKYQDILKSNLLPLNKDIYATDDYDRFLSERAGLIVQYVDELTT